MDDYIVLIFGCTILSTQFSPPGRVVIVGGGSAGWMTASVFLNSLGRAGSQIVLVESDRIPTIGVGEGTTPLFKRFLEFNGITETEFMANCNSTYKLGINFPGWTDSDEFDSYFHPFIATGYNQYDQDFFNSCDRRRSGQHSATSPDDYFFNAEMAWQRRAPVGPPPCDSSKMDYGYHFDTALVAEFLKKRALAAGIEYIVDDVSKVVKDGKGDISHIVTENHGDVAGDFFVDCTGFRRLLIGDTLDVDAISYKPRLFNDSAVVIRTPDNGEADIPPYTESTALECGWAWCIPLRGKTSWGYVYSADYTTKEDAEAELRRHIGESAGDIKALHIKLRTGRNLEHWKNNCLAVGLSQGFIEPLEATALALTQFTINRFVTHFARGNYQSTHRDFFNGIINEAFDCTIDYIQLHYKLNTRQDTEYWKDCRDNENITATQKAIIDGWESGEDFINVLRNHVHRSSYAPYSWYCILSGMGRYGSHTMDGEKLRNANPHRDTVAGYSSHQAYLESLQG